MKSLFAILVLTSSMALASDDGFEIPGYNTGSRNGNGSAASNDWTCWARGKQSMGGPVGDIWQTVRGNGATRFDALTDAQDNCFGRGLQSCMVDNCYQN